MGTGLLRPASSGMALQTGGRAVGVGLTVRMPQEQATPRKWGHYANKGFWRTSELVKIGIGIMITWHRPQSAIYNKKISLFTPSILPHPLSTFSRPPQPFLLTPLLVPAAAGAPAAKNSSYASPLILSTTALTWALVRPEPSQTLPSCNGRNAKRGVSKCYSDSDSDERGEERTARGAKE